MKILIVCLAIFLASGSLILVTKPTLLQEMSFSQAIYDEEYRLLRLTLTPDEKYRVYTPLEKIAPHFIQTTLLQEDQYFFFHPGFNPFALIKAAWQTYGMQTRQMGASTITMQVARLCYGLHTKSPAGKLWQILKAVQLELFYSKEQILEAYLNLASYGGNIEGIGAASLIYFDKSPEQLTFAEALSLSVVPQNPNRRALHLSNQEERQQAYSVLYHRWIKEHPDNTELLDHLALPPQYCKKNLPFLAPHFVESILRHNQQRTIITSLNYSLQALIEKIIGHYLQQTQALGIQNASCMLVDTRNMEIKAAVGSGNYFDDAISGQINGTKAKRSPGSALKPLIYALAMDQGIIHPYTVLKDAPASFCGYNPENFDHGFMGPIKVKDALIFSRNIPAIQLMQKLKNPNLYQLLEQAQVQGLKEERDYGLSLALGSAEVTMEELIQLYAMLANQGLWHPLQTYKESLKNGSRLISPEAAFLTLDMLRDTPRHYRKKAAQDCEFPVFWKTGTSSGYRDAWSVGIFGPYVLAVWIGNFNGKGNPSFVGTTAAAPLFFRLIDAIHHKLGKLPEVIQNISTMNLTKVDVCEASGMLSTRCCPCTASTWFIPGKSPIQKDDIHREIAIDCKTGLRTSKIDATTQFAVYEFWPSDLAKLFAEAGIKRNLPPPFGPEEEPLDNIEGNSPIIISPQSGMTYPLRLNKSNPDIHFLATAEVDVQKLYWFVNQSFVGSCQPNQPLKWSLKSGNHSIRVVDDHGRIASRDFVVKAIE